MNPLSSLVILSIILAHPTLAATTKTITDPGNPRKFFRATTIVPRTL